MAVEVRIPTILRNFTGGAKAVDGAGDAFAGGFFRDAQCGGHAIVG